MAKGAANSSNNSDSDHLDIILLCTKLCLSNALSTRIMRSILITHIKLPTDNDYIQSHKKGTAKFAETAAKLRTEDGLTPFHIRERIGLSHIAGFNMLVTTYKQRIAQVPEKLQKLEEFLNANKAKKWKAYADQVRHSVVSKNWDRSYMKLEIRVEERALHVQQNIYDCFALWMDMKADILSIQEAEELPGVAPRGDLERKIQEWIDNNGGKKNVD